MQGVLLFLPVLLAILAAGSANGEAVSEVEGFLQLPKLQEKAEVSLDRETRDAAKKKNNGKEKNKSGRNLKTGKNKRKGKPNRQKRKNKNGKPGKNKNKKLSKKRSNRVKKGKEKGSKKKDKSKRRNNRIKKKKKSIKPKQAKKGRNVKNQKKRDKKGQKAARKADKKKKKKKQKGRKSNRKVGGKKKSNRKGKKKKRKDSKKVKRRKNKKSKQEKKRLRAERKKHRKAKKTKNTGRQETGDWAACGTTGVIDACLLNAVDALNFEKNQIQNFFKQKARLENHNKTTGNKLNKNDNFNTSAKYMLTAIGGDIDNPTCGENTTVRNSSKESATSNFKTLQNCSVSIKEACTMPETIIDKAKLDTCAALFEQSKKDSEDCRTNEAYTTDGPAACGCWEKAAIGIAAAKKEGCSTVGSNTAKAVKKQKKKCIAAFSACKKTEDAAIQLIHACMSGEVNSTTTRFLNF